MVYCQTYWLAFIGVILAAIENGYAIRCWKCLSSLDSTCETYFTTTNVLLNETAIDDYDNYGNRIPKLANCGEGLGANGQYKAVCYKRVALGPDGSNKVTRSCRVVSNKFKVGACPEDMPYGGNNKNVYSCRTCETDSCNSAGRNSHIVVGLVPAIIMWLGK